MSVAPDTRSAPVADAAELARFGALAHGFWDPAGPLRTLHAINPARISYIATRCQLPGARLADVGCGGGLLAESLARLDASVTAIDLAPEMIEVARLHAAEAAISVDYRLESSAALAARAAGQFAVVTCMELIEHVPDPAALMGDLARLLAPGGRLFLSTLNRTPAAFMGAIVAAEYLLRLVPRGTHRYAQFIRPAEMARWARAAGLELLDVSGLQYDPFRHSARLGGSPDINYLACFGKPT